MLVIQVNSMEHLVVKKNNMCIIKNAATVTYKQARKLRGMEWKPHKKSTVCVILQKNYKTHANDDRKH